MEKTDAEAVAVIDACYDSASGNSTSTSTSTSEGQGLPPAVEKKGPYIVVYGESEDEREITWATRADKTQVLLRTCLTQVGAQGKSFLYLCHIGE